MPPVQSSTAHTNSGLTTPSAPASPGTASTRRQRRRAPAPGRRGCEARRRPHAPARTRSRSGTDALRGDARTTRPSRRLRVGDAHRVRNIHAEIVVPAVALGHELITVEDTDRSIVAGEDGQSAVSSGGGRRSVTSAAPCTSAATQAAGVTPVRAVRGPAEATGDDDRFAHALVSSLFTSAAPASASRGRPPAG